MQHQMIEKYLARPLRWMLQQNVSYWHKALYQFSRKDGEYQLVPLKTQRPGRVVIISRIHYQEFVKYYPITRISELKQVLKTEFQHKNNVLHFIGPVDQQRRAVCSIVIADETVDCFERNCMLIPETLMLWQAVKADKSVKQPVVYEVTAFAGYFLYCAEAIPVSQRVNSFCPDYNSFVLNNGVSDLAHCQAIPDKQYANKLVNALQKTLPVIAKLALFRRPAINTVALPFKAMAITAGTLAVVYMLLVAAYYQYFLNKRQFEISQLGTEIEELLNIQQQAQTTSVAAEQLLQHRADKFYSAHLWQVLITLLQDDASLILQNLATENSRIVLRGQASQATAVLTQLQSSALVSDARFDASVRRQRDKDIFVISLLMNQQTTATSVLQSTSTVLEQPDVSNGGE
jgi:hypothetical protein